MNPIIVIIKSLLWWLNQPFMPLFLGGGQIHIQTFQPNIPTYAGLQHEKKEVAENQ